MFHLIGRFTAAGPHATLVVASGKDKTGPSKEWIINVSITNTTVEEEPEVNHRVPLTISAHRDGVPPVRQIFPSLTM